MSTLRGGRVPARLDLRVDAGPRPDGGAGAPEHGLRARLAPDGAGDALRSRALLRVEQGWTRIGRSEAADLRLDDPSVSRRHALIVSELPDSLRVLDDRSLNGVFLNGEIVEWARVEDGDELAIGCFRLFALER